MNATLDMPSPAPVGSTGPYIQCAVTAIFSCMGCPRDGAAGAGRSSLVIDAVPSCSIQGVAALPPSMSTQVTRHFAI